ncbi:MAG: recombinase family protein [Chromatiaceae bacterium]
MKTVAYLRVSTVSQAESGAGLAAQEDACRRAAPSLASVYRDEGVSGSTGLDKRPALLAAIGELGKGDALIVGKRDRLGRDPLVVAMIESAVKRKGAKIISAAGEGTDSDEPSAILMRRMVDAFAEYERLIIGARTRAALKAKQARGERTGSIPFGYLLAEDGSTLIPHAQEQVIISEARVMREAGLSLRQIASQLAALGFKARNGSIFLPAQVSRMLAA